jgi:tetratricopeptide (TPR) repeat protein
MEKAKTLAPDDPLPRLTLAELAVVSTGDTAAARRMVAEALERSGPERAVPEAITSGDTRILFYIQPDSTMIRLLLRPTLAHFGRDSSRYYAWQARVYQLERRDTEVRAYADSARRTLETSARILPEDAGYHAMLGLAYAQLGRKDNAIREGQKALALRPPSKDAWGGADNVLNLAEIYALLGNSEGAIEQLQRLAQEPGETNFIGSALRYDFRFAALRDNPAFRRLQGR